jgi:5-methylcytosine-specific restriction protein A
VVSIELDNFARPALEALFDNFRDNRSALLDHISEILGSCESTFYIDGAAFAKPSELPLEVWRNFAFDVREPIDELSDPFTILERVAVKSLAVLLNLLPVETPRPVGVDEETGFPEGASMQVLVNRYERDPRNRSAAIAIHGSTCAVCDFSFEAQYGDTGLGYIEVHHLKPLSTLGANYQINPSTDLVPLCSNCHSMVHRRKPPYTPSELRQKLST